MGFFKKRKDKSGAERTMLAGSVNVGEVDWNVREEKRGGEQSQIFVLQRADDPTSEMHIRPLPGLAATTLEEVQNLAADPTYRFFNDPGGRRWEARIVISDTPGQVPTRLVKFISRMDVREVPYPHDTGLGLRTDSELRDLLPEITESS